MDMLFVYGTLRRAAGHERHALLAALADFVDEATVTGHLWVVDWYPGLVLHPQGPVVVGELWRLRPGTDLLPLDRYEGCAADDPAPHEYRRVRVPARATATAATMTAWTYEYLGTTARLRHVPSGDWTRR
jgi:gamma-glutamylcyclotransferase (GGCT)/AIG2-like uncharacterized protein YtfP